MLILVDQDGPLADFESGFLDSFRNQFPEEAWVPTEERQSFYIKDDYPSHLRSIVEDVYCSPGFYRNLSPVQGSISAIKQLREFGHDVFICTSPLSRYENCVLEKYQWIERHLGRKFIESVVLTKDKTIVKGDVLFDDRPSIKGRSAPSWEHVLFACSYNKDVKGKRRMNWIEFAQMIIGGAS